MKTYSLPDHALVTQAMVEKLDHLLFSANPTQLKNHLTTVFLKYLENEHEQLPPAFEEMVTDFNLLMELLVVMERGDS